MFIDPHHYVAAINAEHDELARDLERARQIDQLRSRHWPLSMAFTAARASLGGRLIHLGERVQGSPASAAA